MAEFDTRDTATRVKIVWGLHILTAVAGVTAVIGVVLAYIWRDSDPAHPLNTHFAKAIRVFWITAALMLAGLVLSLVGIGFLLMAAAGLYMLVMAVIGLVRAFDGKAWP